MAYCRYRHYFRGDIRSDVQCVVELFHVKTALEYSDFFDLQYIWRNGNGVVILKRNVQLHKPLVAWNVVVIGYTAHYSFLFLRQN